MREPAGWGILDPVTDSPGGYERPLDIQRPLDEGRPAEVALPASEPSAPDAAQVAAVTAIEPVEAEPAEPAEPAQATELAEPAEAPAAAPPVTPLLRPAAPVSPVATAQADPGDDADGDPTAAPDASVTEPTIVLDPDAPVDDSRPPLALVARRRLGRVLRGTQVAVANRARALAAWARGPAGRLVLPGLLTAVLLAATLSTGAVVMPAAWNASDDPPTRPGGVLPADPLAPPSGPPVFVPPVNPPGTAPPTAGNRPAPLTAWAEEMSERTGIPVVAMTAYGYAEVVAADTQPTCNLRWTTLAGIGQVESGHASAGGATLLPDGRALPPIIGDPLDGEGGRLHIPDTDDGELDQDTIYDRAVGPMQFIPTTWRLEAVDGNGDGIADINNIFDAALAAANYLCRGRDLSDPVQWLAAIRSYNDVTAYVNAVFAAANEFGQRSQSG